MVTVATSRKKTGLPALTPTTMSATSSALRKNSPASTLSICVAPLLALRCTTAPAGMPKLAAEMVFCRVIRSTPRSRMRVGSTSICIERPGPPMVLTSRTPATAFNSPSSVWATASRSIAGLPSLLHSVMPTTGTSSMPLGLTMGGKVPSSRGSQSWLALSTSYKRTSASVRGTPTLNCTVSTATPGRDTE